MRIAICDDDKDFIRNMEKLLKQASKGVDITVASYSTGEKLLEDYRDRHICYDVIFLDIMLPDMNGIALGKQLKELEEDMLLILLTNYEQYAVEGYEAKAFRYLLKPIDENLLKNVLADIKKERSRRQWIRISTNGEEVLVPLSKVLFLEAKEKYTTIYIDGQSYLSRMSLNQYEKQLGSRGFCRIHRKYLVNLCNVTRWNARRVEAGGHMLPISRRKEKEFREQLYGFLEKGSRE